ncbi:MAG: protein kinase, partial [Planctomycetota bacterium]
MSNPGSALPALVPIPTRFDVAKSASTSESGALIRATERSSGRTVGLRRLSPEFTTNPEALEKLLLLDHPNLLPVTEVLRDEAGIYLVTEWTERGTLADRLEVGFPSAIVLHLVARGVSRALNYLHARSIAPAKLATDQILETDQGQFQIAGYGVPEDSGEETSCNPGQEESDSATDRFRVDLVSFGRLIEKLRHELPPSLRTLCRRCRPDAPDSFLKADELLRELEGLPDMLALAEFDHDAEQIDAAEDERRDSRDPRNTPSDSAGESFPWRPLEDLYELEGSSKKGGMGSVWMAREKSTGRKVAIKRLL